MAAAQAEPPPLRHISIDTVSKLESTPSQKIRLDEDLDAWRTTTGYRDYSVFLRRLNESVVGYFLPWSSSTPTEVRADTRWEIDRVKCLL